MNMSLGDRKKSYIYMSKHFVSGIDLRHLYYEQITVHDS